MNTLRHYPKCTTQPTVLIAFIIVAMLASSISWAGGRGHRSVDFARVVKVEPIRKTVERRIPEEVCWTEQVRYDDLSHRDSVYHNNSYTSTILGGIIGGAIGNAVGHRKGNKKVGTAVGAILGASVGNDIGARDTRHHRVPPRYREVRRCETEHHTRYDEKIVGYHVWYRYNGEKYKTRMNHRPGKKIKVRVSVEPI